MIYAIYINIIYIPLLTISMSYMILLMYSQVLKRKVKRKKKS